MRGEECCPLAQQSVWRPTSPRPPEEEKMECVCLCMVPHECVLMCWRVCLYFHVCGGGWAVICCHTQSVSVCSACVCVMQLHSVPAISSPNKYWLMGMKSKVKSLVNLNSDLFQWRLWAACTSLASKRHYIMQGMLYFIDLLKKSWFCLPTSVGIKSAAELPLKAS